MLKFLATLLLFTILIIGAGFAALNAQSVVLSYYFGELALPLALLIALTLALGSFLGIIASSGLLLRAELRNRSLQRQINLAEEEVANLRTLPLQDMS